LITFAYLTRTVDLLLDSSFDLNREVDLVLLAVILVGGCLILGIGQVFLSGGTYFSLIFFYLGRSALVNGAFD
jgi:hypothetical protein